jgi:hypothetical protein
LSKLKIQSVTLFVQVIDSWRKKTPEEIEEEQSRKVRRIIPSLFIKAQSVNINDQSKFKVPLDALNI